MLHEVCLNLVSIVIIFNETADPVIEDARATCRFEQASVQIKPRNQNMYSHINIGHKKTMKSRRGVYLASWHSEVEDVMCTLIPIIGAPEASGAPSRVL